jgi:AcrR family transcriptional regulator
MDTSLWTKEKIAERFRQYLGDEADQSREARRRRAILAAGYQLFLHHGYKKTTVDDIARKANVAKGTVYLYFKNKAELLLRCVAYEKQVLKDEIGKLLAPETPDRDRLRHWLRLAMFAVRDMPLSSRLMTGDLEMWDALDDAGSEQYAKMMKEGVDLCAHLIELAAPGVFDDEEKRKRVEVLMAMSFVSATFLDPRTRSDRELEPFLDTMVEVLLHGTLHPAARPDEAGRQREEGPREPLPPHAAGGDRGR